MPGGLAHDKGMCEQVWITKITKVHYPTDTGEKQRLFTSSNYQAKSWTRPRRIIAKVEYTRLGANQRFMLPT